MINAIQLNRTEIWLCLRWKKEKHGHLPAIAIVGRPNDKKVNAFNRIAGEFPLWKDVERGDPRPNLYGQQLNRKFSIIITGGIDDVDAFYGTVKHQAESPWTKQMSSFLSYGKEGSTECRQ